MNKKCGKCKFYTPIIESGKKDDYGMCRKTLGTVVKNEICVIDALKEVHVNEFGR